VPGDFSRDSLPVGADLITFVRVLHDHDDSRVERMLRAAYEALPPGGRLLVAEPMAGTAGATRMGDAYFGLYLWAMGSGRPRTAAELSAMLRAAGFSRIRCRPTRIPLQTSVLVAERE
jgi:demethylspheroidene O-methyltransferase